MDTSDQPGGSGAQKAQPGQPAKQLGSATQADTQPATPQSSLPSIQVPKGGGAIRGIGESFKINAVTGTAAVSIPIATSQARSNISPQLTLSYDSGSGNGPFGLGWQLQLPSITRKTDKGLPKYQDAEESDLFILTGEEDLLPVLEPDHNGSWTRSEFETRFGAESFTVRKYKPRVENSFLRIERWTNSKSGDIHWRTISRDNVTSVFGENSNSKIFDPSNPVRVFTWLVSQTYDGKGNVMKYEYKSENSEMVDLSKAHENFRTESSRSANKYPKRIKYGNRRSRLLNDFSLENEAWMFEVVFDYGDHDEQTPGVHESQPWPARSDQFSTYRPTFELRIYRLCQRVLVFHNFPEEESVGNGCLVSSTDLKYRDTCKDNHSASVGDSIASFISSISHTSYVRSGQGYLRKSIPPLEFGYTHARIAHEVKDVDPESLENIPAGLGDSKYEFQDLNGEGVSGILSRQGGAFFYKPNIGQAKFGPVESIGELPSLFTYPAKSQQWLDLAGDGDVSLVQFDGTHPGFYKRNKEVPSGWEGFRAFSSLPNISWEDPNLKLVDLRGTGLADVLIVNEDIFTYFPAMAEEGFGVADYWRLPLDEDAGPRLLFSDGVEAVYLADMSGDGMSDLLRARNGEVCYWPNLGYGRFGPKVVMDNAPWFDNPDLFQQSSLQLADVDGSGTTDIVYIGRNGVSVYLNQSGNSWTDGETIQNFPAYSQVINTQVIDLMGRGTSCLVWSSDLPGDSGRQMRYIDLMSESKPYLMTSMVNNFGTERHMKYKPSTSYYLADKALGKPWATRLPFPVQVLSSVEILDRVSGNRLITNYAYHEGYYDGVEREFRGFGYIESWDTETFAENPAKDGPETSKGQSGASNFDPAFRSPPVWTKTWYHTGALLENSTIMKHFRSEFYREPGLDQEEMDSLLPPETAIPSSIRVGNKFLSYDLSMEEDREAYRCLRGSILRTETYALDGTPQESQPYQVVHNNYTIDMLQPHGPNRYAMYFVHQKETVTFDYERSLYPVAGRMLADPRVSHTLNLATDEYGNVLVAVNISYGRRFDDPVLSADDRAKQNQMLATLTLQRFTNSVNDPNSYRLPLLCEAQTFELVKFLDMSSHSVIPPLLHAKGVFGVVNSLASGQYDLPFEDFKGAGAIGGHVYRRRLTRKRTLFRSNDLSRVLGFGTVESLALTYETYSQVFTPSLVSDTYVGTNRFGTSSQLTSALEGPGGYVHSEGDENWWIPSGLTFFSPKSADSAPKEFAYAEKHFYLPQRYRDPFWSTTFDTEQFASYDKYDLLAIETHDTLGNFFTVGIRDDDPTKPLQKSGYDYRLLVPYLVMDPNRNVTAVAYDILGQVTATAIMGKPGSNMGDKLSGFNLNMTESEISDYLGNPLLEPGKILGDATSRVVYDLWSYWRRKSTSQPLPVVTATLTRETHVSDLALDQKSRVQQSFAYSDGFARRIQTKILAEHDPVTHLPRWIASGWQIFNNKGSAVRKYEPFFTATNLYESNAAAGVSSTLFYDPLQRVVAKLDPNHLFSKTTWDSWSQHAWDQSDTLLIDPSRDPDVSGYFQRMPKADYLPTWYAARVDGAMGSEEKTAALKSVVHAHTPDKLYFDSLGRPFLTVSHNALQRTGSAKPLEESFMVRKFLDISGNVRSITDSLGRTVEISSYDMTKNVLQKNSMEAGVKWALFSATKKLIFTSNGRGYQISTTFDQLQRPLDAKLQHRNGQVFLVSRNRYGESEPNPESLNLRTRVVEAWDQATVKKLSSYDFKGNLLSTDTQYPAKYSSDIIDWTKVETNALDSEIYHVSTTYDALNRPVTVTQPDRSVTKTAYNITNQVQRIDVQIEGNNDWKAVLVDEQFNARNQCILSTHGNGAHTKYSYDPFTFSLVNLVTTKVRGANKAESNSQTSSKATLQDLHYTYDPVKNTTHIRDDAQQRVFFKDQVVDPTCSYTYDALYRLIEASGREHLGQSGSPMPYGSSDSRQTKLYSPGDGNAMGRYFESYYLDAVGNMLRLQHSGSDPSKPGWTRRYKYGEASQIEPNVFSNRLSSTEIGTSTEHYQYDADAGLDGNLTSMPHLAAMQWDFRDHLHSTAAQRVQSGTPETTWYTYHDDGTRARKVTNNSAKAEQPALKKSERLYLGAYEVYREYASNGQDVTLERKTLHVLNGGHRIALIDNQTLGDSDGPRQLFRYQYTNNLESSVLELDEEGQLISYEEYYPYGSTSYQAVRSQLCDPKRYRYAGKERDQENGLYYYGARYYASWLGRWTSCDPAGPADSLSLYVFVKSNPVKFVDPQGMESDTPMQPHDVKLDPAVIQPKAKLPGIKAPSLALKHIDPPSQQGPQLTMPQFKTPGYKVGDLPKTGLEADLNLHPQPPPRPPLVAWPPTVPPPTPPPPGQPNLANPPAGPPKIASSLDLYNKITQVTQLEAPFGENIKFGLPAQLKWQADLPGGFQMDGSAQLKLQGTPYAPQEGVLSLQIGKTTNQPTPPQSLDKDNMLVQRLGQDAYSLVHSPSFDKGDQVRQDLNDTADVLHPDPDDKGISTSVGVTLGMPIGSQSNDPPPLGQQLPHKLDDTKGWFIQFSVGGMF